MTFSETLKRSWYVVIFFLIILAISIGITLVIFGIPILKSPTPSISLIKINESGIPNGTFIHISDKDFEDFPKVAQLFHGTQQDPLVYANGTRIIYGISLSWEEVPKFQGSIFGQHKLNRTTGENELFYEYNGSYYYFGGIAIP
jgi:hypothetical protein